MSYNLCESVCIGGLLWLHGSSLLEGACQTRAIVGPDRYRIFWASYLLCEVMADCYARQELEDAWNEAVGEPTATRRGWVKCDVGC